MVIRRWTRPSPMAWGNLTKQVDVETLLQIDPRQGKFSRKPHLILSRSAGHEINYFPFSGEIQGQEKSPRKV